MLSQFLPAFEFMIVNEDVPHSWAAKTDNDGGVVIAGINSKSFPHALAAILSLQQANRGPAIQTFYFSQIWTPSKIGGLEEQELANRVFDQAVNSGVRKAVKLLQAAIGMAPADCDGLIGPATLENANTV